MYFDLIISGFGGQGVMFLGSLLAYAAMSDGHRCTYLPVYGPEMRGGTAHCTVVISDEEIGSPIIQHPTAAIVMNQPSLLKFGPKVKKDGLLLVNASLIDDSEPLVEGLEVILIPATELAREAGGDRLANMVMLGALAARSGITTIPCVIRALEHTLPERAKSFLPRNIQALERGADFIQTWSPPHSG